MLLNLCDRLITIPWHLLSSIQRSRKSEEIGENQLSGFSFRRGQISPLVHVALNFPCAHMFLSIQWLMLEPYTAIVECFIMYKLCIIL